MAENTSIRQAVENDAEAISAIYRPIVASTVASFELEPPSPVEFRRRIATIGLTHPWLVAERSGRVLGYVYASSHRVRAAYQWSAEVTAYVHPEAKRQGLGRALYTSLFALMRIYGFQNAYAGITLPNEGSVRLHEAMGFRPIGVYPKVGFKSGAWHDVGWWGLELGPKPAALDPPRDTAQARLDAGWQAATDSGLARLNNGGAAR